MNIRFVVIEARRWRNPHNGATRLAHRPGPPTNGPEWIDESCGWTVKDEKTGEIGFGKEPFPDKTEAESFAAFLNDIPSLNPQAQPPPIKRPDRKPAPVASPSPRKPAPTLEPAEAGWLL